MTWKYNQTIDPDGRVLACQMISHNHLAVCLISCVKVFEVSSGTSHLAYTVTSDDWTGKCVVGTAVSAALPGTMLAIREYKPCVYQFPLCESTKEIEKYKIQCDTEDPWCLAANDDIAVIAMYGQQSILVYQLPEFSPKSQISIDFQPFDLSISTDHLLVMGVEQIAVRSCDDIHRDISRVSTTSDGWEFQSVSFRGNTREVYVGCRRGMHGRINRYTWDGVGKTDYVNSSCIIDDLDRVWQRCLTIQDRFLVVDQSNTLMMYTLE